jgi:hypothetical protein
MADSMGPWWINKLDKNLRLRGLGVGTKIQKRSII